MFKRTLAALTLAFGLSSAHAEDKPPVVITLAGPLTGDDATNGGDMLAGARAAAKTVNENGGILDDRSIEIVPEDDAGQQKQGVSVAERIAGSGRSFVVGHLGSNITKPASEVYNEYKIVQITLSQSVDVLRQGYESLFRINPNAKVLANATMDLVESAVKAGNNRIAVIGNEGEYERSLSKALLGNLEERSIKPAMVDHYPPDEYSFEALISKMKAERISLVLIAGSDKEMGLIVRQSADQGFDPAFILSSTAASADFAALAGCAAEGVQVVAAWNPLYTPGFEDLRNLLQAEGANGIDTAINAYSATLLMAQAIDRAGTEDPAIVAQTLHEGTFDLPIGPVQFTDSGELVDPKAIVYKYQPDSIPCTRVEMRPVGP